MNKLEEYIRKHREDLDRYNPPVSIWKGIRHELHENKIRIRLWLSAAAMIAIVFGTALLLLKPSILSSDRYKQKRNNELFSATDPQLKETEVYYNSMVNQLYNEAKPMLTNNPDIKKELNTDLSQLDSICADLKKDLKDNISNQEVVEALIQNYRIKISILEDMLKVLKSNEKDSEKKKSNEL